MCVRQGESHARVPETMRPHTDRLPDPEDTCHLEAPHSATSCAQVLTLCQVLGTQGSGVAGVGGGDGKKLMCIKCPRYFGYLDIILNI